MLILQLKKQFQLNFFLSLHKELMQELNLTGRLQLKQTTQALHIERSRDEENFTQIGFVSGRGTTTEITSYNYLDTEIETGKYYYRLKQTDFDGTFKYLNVVLVDVGLPKQFQLSQNHPNPFNPTTTIKFQLPVDANVRIELFNSIGQKVSELLNSDLSGGVHEVSFEGSNLSSGIYYYTMNAVGKDGSNFTSTKKMILMK